MKRIYFQFNVPQECTVRNRCNLFVNVEATEENGDVQIYIFFARNTVAVIDQLAQASKLYNLASVRAAELLVSGQYSSLPPADDDTPFSEPAQNVLVTVIDSIKVPAAKTAHVAGYGSKEFYEDEQNRFTQRELDHYMMMEEMDQYNGYPAY